MNVGIIGCGRVSEIHMCAYGNIPGTNVIGVSDLKIERAKDFAQKYRIKAAFQDYLQLLEMKDVDLIDICTPINTHAKIAVEVAKSGHNMFLEKPMARSSEECDRVISEVQKSKVKLCICHNQLFLPHVMDAKALVDSGSFPLTYFRVSVRESAELIGAPSWVMTPEQGGALWETGAHCAYLQLHFLGNVRKVSAIGEKVKHPVHDHLIALLETSHEAIGVIEISWLARKEEVAFNLIGSDGREIRIMNYNFCTECPSTLPSSILQGSYRDQKQVMKKWSSFLLENLRNRRLRSCLPQYILLTEYMNSIRNDLEPPVTPQDGRKTVQLLERIEESLNRNRPLDMKSE